MCRSVGYLLLACLALVGCNRSGPMRREGVASAEAERDLRQELETLRVRVADACATVPEQARQACPVDGQHVEAIEAIESGYVVRLRDTGASRQELQRQVDCYHAHHALGVLTGEAVLDPSSTCLLDVPGTDVDVRVGDEGRPRVRITANDVPQRKQLRATVERLSARAAVDVRAGR